MEYIPGLGAKSFKFPAAFCTSLFEYIKIDRACSSFNLCFTQASSTYLLTENVNYKQHIYIH